MTQTVASGLTPFAGILCNMHITVDALWSSWRYTKITSAHLVTAQVVEPRHHVYVIDSV